MNIIRKLRKNANLTQKELADMLELNCSSISKYETGDAVPSKDVLRRMSEIFNYDLSHSLDAIKSNLKITVASSDIDGTLNDIYKYSRPSGLGFSSFVDTPAFRSSFTNPTILNEQFHQKITKIKNSLLKSSQGKCEFCHKNAPFNDCSGNPYLKLFFVTPLDSGGRINEKNAVLLCPDCFEKAYVLALPEDIKTLNAIASEHPEID